MGPRESQDLRSPSPIMAPDSVRFLGANKLTICVQCRKQVSRLNHTFAVQHDSFNLTPLI